MSERKRILSGARPTAPLHLGHYAGALENWVELQHKYDCTVLTQPRAPLPLRDR